MSPMTKEGTIEKDPGKRMCEEVVVVDVPKLRRRTGIDSREDQ